MRILISNDDGITSEGILALMRAFSQQHEVVLSAPMYEQSGMSHALNVHRPLEVVRDMDLEGQYGIEAWKIDGTPTDCVKLYLEAIGKDRLPDIVLSGINHGANLATDVLYSGTVGAAMEGYLHDLPAVALSLDRKSSITYDEVANITVAYIEKLMLEEEKPFFYNINFPVRFAQDTPSFVFSRTGRRDYINAFERHEENGRLFYTVSGEIFDVDCGEATDIYATSQGWIAVTPLHTDLTNYTRMDFEIQKGNSDNL